MRIFLEPELHRITIHCLNAHVAGPVKLHGGTCMNSEKISKAPVTNAGADQPQKIGSVEEIMALGIPVGAWGGSEDILLRIRNCKPVAANKIESVQETMARGTVLGIFGGSTDIVFRIRNGKPVAADKVGSVAEMVTLGTAVGTWGGSNDILLRIRNRELVAANVGGQGGGQN
jgi:hypothetical protein